MESRFKFRAYGSIDFNRPDCEVKKRMYYFDLNSMIPNLKNIELMQCTGLKDKNGKLIYEGDVIEHNRYVSKGIVKCGKYILKNETKHDRQKHHIGWYVEEKEEFKDRDYVNIKSLEELFFYIDENYTPKRFDNSVEIIGNFHENPELYDHIEPEDDEEEERALANLHSHHS